MKRVVRYTLYQLPSAGIAGLLSFLAYSFNWIGIWTASSVVVIWILKDAILYPFVKSAYEGGEHGVRAMVGLTGEVLFPLNPEGKIRVKGEVWKARSENLDEIQSGASVIIVGSEGRTLLVKKDSDP